MKSSNDGSYLIISTENNKYYLYDVNSEFLYDKFNRMNIAVIDLFFSKKNFNIYAGLPNGNIFV